MATMAKDKFFIAQQPNFGYTLEARYNQTMDDWRVTHNNSVATPAKKFGIFVAFGSDNLPIDPRVGLYFATTRRGPDGVRHGYEEERVSRPEAIRMYTANGPYLSWEEKIKGTLEPGKLADMIVLDGDILTVPDGQLLPCRLIEPTSVGNSFTNAARGSIGSGRGPSAGRPGGLRSQGVPRLRLEGVTRSSTRCRSISCRKD